METSSIKQKEIIRDWYIFDADGQVLGRLASEIAQLIRGKNKPYYTPHMDMGDFVIVINADKIKVTGNKEADKMYWRHSGYPGGLTEYNLASLRDKHPDRLISKAVKGMLPSNKLGHKLLSHLKVFKGTDHPHSAQNPKLIRLK